MKKYKVKEIFGPTIQGEGTHAGKVVSFLRFANCNRWNGKAESKPKSICNYCDTDFVGGEEMDVYDIIMALKKIKCDTVILSGGEPTLQMTDNLLYQMKIAGFEIHLETNGSRDIGDMLRYLDHVTMSPKQNRTRTRLRSCDDLKILFPFIAKDITAESFKDFPCTHRILQPVERDGDMATSETIKELYQLRDWKLGLQLHKILGVE